MLELIFITLQIIQVNQTDPCFMNLTAGADMWENCGYGEDYLQAMLLPWEWITGGYFSMIFVSLLITVTYIKYHKAIYPLIIGFIFLPLSYYLFPQQFLNIAFIVIGIIFGIFIFTILLRRTKEYDD